MSDDMYPSLQCHKEDLHCHKNQLCATWSSLVPNPWNAMIFVLSLQCCLFQNVIYVLRIIQWTAFHISCFHTVTCIYGFSMSFHALIGFFFSAVMDQGLFIQSPIEGHRGCFHASAITKRATQHLCASFHVDITFWLIYVNNKEQDGWIIMQKLCLVL